jgi:hypothetical protein
MGFVVQHQTLIFRKQKGTSSQLDTRKCRSSRFWGWIYGWLTAHICVAREKKYWIARNLHHLFCIFSFNLSQFICLLTLNIAQRIRTQSIIHYYPTKNRFLCFSVHRRSYNYWYFFLIIISMFFQILSSKPSYYLSSFLLRASNETYKLIFYF